MTVANFSKTVYRVPNPEFEVSEAYEIAIEAVTNSKVPQKCWIVWELHGWYDEDSKQFHYKVETLHPTDPDNFMAIEEAQKFADRQVLLRAKQGFHFLFVKNCQEVPWYNRYEVVLPAGEIKPLS